MRNGGDANTIFSVRREFINEIECFQDERKLFFVERLLCVLPIDECI